MYSGYVLFCQLHALQIFLSSLPFYSFNSVCISYNFLVVFSERVQNHLVNYCQKQNLVFLLIAKCYINNACIVIKTEQLSVGTDREYFFKDSKLKSKPILAT